MNLRAPPSGPVRWIATLPLRRGVPPFVIEAQTWFVARDKACSLLNCGREEVVVVEEGTPT